MTRLLTIILFLAALFFPLAAGADGNVPDAALSIAKQLDNQLMERFTGHSAGFLDSQASQTAREGIIIMGTTPANINNLQQANALARQMTEEISRLLVSRGYRYNELRKGADIRFDPRVGEFILTRQVPQLASKFGQGTAVMAGTYVMSGEDVRFSISLISADTNAVLAKATATVPITPDLRPMLVENYGAGSGTTPTVSTRLQ